MANRFKKYMTKTQVMEDFKHYYADIVNSSDKPLKRMTWNNYVDTLQKNGAVNPKADWCQPAFIKN